MVYAGFGLLGSVTAVVYDIFTLFQEICAVVFWPVAALMGVEIEDAGKIASLIGTKVFVDEFISFKDLGDMVRKGEVQVSGTHTYRQTERQTDRQSVIYSVSKKGGRADGGSDIDVI